MSLDLNKLNATTVSCNKNIELWLKGDIHAAFNIVNFLLKLYTTTTNPKG